MNANKPLLSDNEIALLLLIAVAGAVGSVGAVVFTSPGLVDRILIAILIVGSTFLAFLGGYELALRGVRRGLTREGS